MIPDRAAAVFRCPCGEGATVDIEETDHPLGGRTIKVAPPLGWAVELPYVESPYYDGAGDGEHSGQLRVRCPDHRDVENFS